MFSCVGTVFVVEMRPYYGAQIANHMRDLFGPQAVAQIEAVVFQVQDTVKHWQYLSGVEEAKAPWVSIATPLDLNPSTQAAIGGSSQIPELKRKGW